MLSPQSLSLRYAHFYDLYTAGFQADLPLYLDAAAKYPAPVMEVGCGTGRLLRGLAREGHEVVGVDVDPGMLALARERLGPDGDHVRIVNHDFRAQPLLERFHVVLVTLHTFNFLIEVEEQRRFLRHLRQSLTEPGRLIIDLFTPRSMIDPESGGVWRGIERQVGGSRLRVQDRRDMLTPLLERRTQRFSVDDQPEAEMITHRRYVPPAIAGELLAEAGFENIVWFENYNPSAAREVRFADQPTGPFLVTGEL